MKPWVRPSHKRPPEMAGAPDRGAFTGSQLLHTMLRVADLERSLHFYTELLGMRLLQRDDYPDGRFTLVFLGYSDTAEAAALELTHNWDTAGYLVGNAFGHVAVSVLDLYQACADLRREGVPIVREPGPAHHGPPELIAFVEDPDHYKVELIQRSPMVHRAATTF